MIADVPLLVAMSWRHRRELVRIPEHDDLHSTERLGTPTSCLPKGTIDGVHDVGVDHRDLVDHEGVDGVQQLAGGIRMLEVGVRDQTDRQAQQRVDRLAFDVEGSDTGGRTDGDLFAGPVGQVLQERRLAGSGPTGHEHVVARVLDESEQRLLLCGEFGRLHRAMLPSARRGRASSQHVVPRLVP